MTALERHAFDVFKLLRVYHEDRRIVQFGKNFEKHLILYRHFF